MNLLNERKMALKIVFLALLAALLLTGASPAGHGAALTQSLETARLASFNALIAKAQENGNVRTIIGLRVDFKPEGELAAASGQNAVNAQRNAIHATQDAVIVSLQGYGVQVTHTYEFIPYMAATLNATALEALKSQPLVASIAEDEINYATLDKSSPLINADDAWAAGYTGNGQTAAIIDTGADKTHPFLGGRVVSEACYSTTYSWPYFSRSLCPGYVQSSTAPGSGVNCSLSIDEGCAHGTHVSGITAGENGPGGMNGVAPDATLIEIQVFSQLGIAYGGGIGAYDSDIVDGLSRVYALRTTFNISSVNMSLGGGTKYTGTCDGGSNAATKSAIDNLRSVGIATVIASGNSGWRDGISSPACISSAVSVGSTTSEIATDGFGYIGQVDVVDFYSNHGSNLDLLAPGTTILSSVPGNSYESWDGTSMAAPQVTGAWAVLKEKDPSASVTTILNALVSTGKPISQAYSSSSRGSLQSVVTKPRIDVKAALDSLSGGTATATTTTTTATTTTTTSTTPAEIIVDNRDAGFSKSGSWNTYSGGVAKIGPDLFYTSSGSATAQWAPNLPSSDDYEVFVWIFRVGNGSANQPFTVQHAGGTTAPMYVNWQTAPSNGAWVSLGTYSFNAGTTGKVMTNGVSGGGFEIADAVKFVGGGTVTPTATTPTSTTPAPSDIIIDNGAGSPEFSVQGSWLTRTECSGVRYLSSFRANAAGGGGDYATFRPTIPTTGTYEVWVWVFTHSLGAPDAPYTVVHAGGSQTFDMNFNGANCGGGGWVYLGTFTFNAGTAGYVRVSDAASSGYVFADAVKFVPVP